MRTPPSPARLIVLYNSNELNRQRAKVAESNVERRREWHFEKGGARRIRVATAYELQHQSRLANRGAHVGVAVRLSATFEITPEHERNFGLDSRVRTF